MRKIAEYLGFAKECRELAERMTRQEDKERLLKIAAAWRKVAEESKLALRGTE